MVQATILVVCILAHLGVWVWLTSVQADSPHAASTPFEVFFIPASAPAEAAPPFPVAPAHTPPRRPRATGNRATATSAPPDVARSEAKPWSPESDALSSARLLDLARMAARESAGSMHLAPRDPTRRYAIPLAGRAEPFTPTAIQLRDPMTAERIMGKIAQLFGGNFTCPDTRSKIEDLVMRNDPRADDELRILLDRERRRCM